jgi:anti-sigma-K factor RskA
MTFDPDPAVPPTARPSRWRRIWSGMRTWRPAAAAAAAGGVRTVVALGLAAAAGLLILYYPWAR